MRASGAEGYFALTMERRRSPELRSLPEATVVGALSACAVKGGAFQWVQVPPGQTLQPEATGAGMEVKKCLKPLGSRHVGDGASVRAATRVNAEQSSKSAMC